MPFRLLFSKTPEPVSTIKAEEDEEKGKSPETI
jgi:hypothetical protein